MEVHVFCLFVFLSSVDESVYISRKYQRKLEFHFSLTRLWLLQDFLALASNIKPVGHNFKKWQIGDCGEERSIRISYFSTQAYTLKKKKKSELSSACFRGFHHYMNACSYCATMSRKEGGLLKFDVFFLSRSLTSYCVLFLQY